MGPYRTPATTLVDKLEKLQWKVYGKESGSGRLQARFLLDSGETAGIVLDFAATKIATTTQPYKLTLTYWRKTHANTVVHENHIDLTNAPETDLEDLNQLVINELRKVRSSKMDELMDILDSKTADLPQG